MAAGPRARAGGRRGLRQYLVDFLAWSANELAQPATFGPGILSARRPRAGRKGACTSRATRHARCVQGTLALGCRERLHAQRGTTPLELALELGARYPGRRLQLQALTGYYNAARYGARPASEAELQHARALLADLAQEPPPRC